MWFVLILVDKWLLLLTLSVPDINRNSAVPAEVLLEKIAFAPVPCFRLSARCSRPSPSPGSSGWAPDRVALFV